MQVRCSEGVAIHTGPKSCVGRREAAGEALAGERAGQPLSGETIINQGADVFEATEGNMSTAVSARLWATLRRLRPWHVTYVFCLGTGRSPLSSWEPFSGPCREGRRPQPMMNDMEKSDPLILPMKPSNKAGQTVAEVVEGSGGPKRHAGEQSTDWTQSRAAVSQAQARIGGAVTRNKQEKLTALLHHVNVAALRAAYLGLKKRAAPGVDGVTWDQYGEDLEANLVDLHARVHRGTYRALPSRRRYIPKMDGRQRPLGIAALEDKIVQAAVVAILTPVYEAEFLGFSYGFRPRRSQHDALDALAYGIKTRKVCWILDADIRSFFDELSREYLVRFLEHRIGDRRIIRLIQKWLKAGVLEEGKEIETEAGTPQGSVASPLMANVYLHYVYDLWVDQWRRRHCTGDMNSRPLRGRHDRWFSAPAGRRAFSRRSQGATGPICAEPASREDPPYRVWQRSCRTSCQVGQGQARDVQFSWLPALLWGQEERRELPTWEKD